MTPKDKYKAPHPKCCADIEKYPVVQASFDPTIVMEGDWEKDKLPKWYAQYVCKEWGGSWRMVEVSHCPFCSKKLPEIVEDKSVPREKVMKVTDGGYYCDNCKERLMACECAAPEAAYKTK